MTEQMGRRARDAGLRLALHGTWWLARLVVDRGAGRRLGRCPGCGTTVFASDPHHRYRGQVLHAEPCMELRAVALSDRR